MFVKSSIPPTASSQPTVNLIRNIVPSPRAPVATGLRHDRWDWHILDNLIRPFEQVDVQTSRHMPSDMAVEWPDTGVVRVDMDDDVAGFGVTDGDGQDLHVSSLRVRGVDDGAVSNSCTTVFARCSPFPITVAVLGLLGSRAGIAKTEEAKKESPSNNRPAIVFNNEIMKQPPNRKTPVGECVGL